MQSKRQTVRKDPFALPRRFTLSHIGPNGSHESYPVLMASYIGMGYDGVPDPDELGEISAIAMDFEHEEGKQDGDLEVVCFLTPQKELLDFAHSRYYALTVDASQTSKFLKQVEQQGRFVFIINTDWYTFRVLVDDQNGEIAESSLEIRYLN